MARLDNKMKSSPKAKTIKVAFWKNPVKEKRDDPNYSIGGKIPSAAKREKELKDLMEQLEE